MSDLFTLEEGIYSKPVHIRKTQRNARKCFTIIEGLADDLDLKKISKYLAKKNQCSSTILDDEKFGQVIKLTGDKRDDVKKFLIDEQICNEEQIHTHG
jgi:translation initiation factor 1